MIDRLTHKSYSVNWIWFGIAVVLLVAAGGLSIALLRVGQINHNENTDLQCIANYENSNYDRAALLTQLNDERNRAQRTDADAEHAALSYAVRPNASPPQVTALIQAWSAASARFQRADDVYQAALRANPLPPPVFSCSSRLRGHRHATSTTPTPRPTPPAPSASATPQAVTTSIRSTVTHSGTSTVVVPGSVVTTTVRVPVPGPRITIVRTRTVTRMVMAPNCFMLPPPGLPCTLSRAG